MSHSTCFHSCWGGGNAFWIILKQVQCGMECLVGRFGAPTCQPLSLLCLTHKATKCAQLFIICPNLIIYFMTCSLQISIHCKTKLKLVFNILLNNILVIGIFRNMTDNFPKIDKTKPQH